MYGQNIRLFRKQKGMNQHELGAAMDVSAVSVSKWEREQTQPDIETLQKLADLFDTSIDELCGRPPKPEDAMDNMSVMCRAFRQMKPEWSGPRSGNFQRHAGGHGGRAKRPPCRSPAEGAMK